jgi:hypothetical protein
VALGVEGLGGAGVPEPGLDDLHRFAVTGEQAAVVVPQILEPGPGREARRLHRRSTSVGVRVALDPTKGWGK